MSDDGVSEWVDGAFSAQSPMKPGDVRGGSRLTLIHWAAIWSLALACMFFLGRCSVESLPKNCDGYGKPPQYSVACRFDLATYPAAMLWRRIEGAGRHTARF